MLEKRDISEPMHVRIYKYVFSVIRAIIQLVAAATIRERRLFRSALAQVRLLFESGVYSRGASIRSYTVYVIVFRPVKCQTERVHHGSEATVLLEPSSLADWQRSHSTRLEKSSSS